MGRPRGRPPGPRGPKPDRRPPLVLVNQSVAVRDADGTLVAVREKVRRGRKLAGMSDIPTLNEFIDDAIEEVRWLFHRDRAR